MIINSNLPLTDRWGRHRNQHRPHNPYLRLVLSAISVRKPGASHPCLQCCSSTRRYGLKRLLAITTFASSDLNNCGKRMHRARFAVLAAVVAAVCQSFVVKTAAAQFTAEKSASDAELADSVLPLATAPPQVLPPLNATGCGCCLRPQLNCRGPVACFCRPPLYYGTYPWDDDWTNPVLQCADGQCGNWWYQRGRAMVERKEACSQAVGTLHSPASSR